MIILRMCLAICEMGLKYNAEIRNVNTFRLKHDLHSSASGMRDSFKINVGIRNEKQ